MFVCEKDKRKSKKVKVASNKNKKVCQHFISKYQTVKVS